MEIQMLFHTRTVASGNPRNWVLNDDGKSDRPPKADENVI
jgi:hypothetical protein